MQLDDVLLGLSSTFWFWEGRFGGLEVNFVESCTHELFCPMQHIEFIPWYEVLTYCG